MAAKIVEVPGVGNVEFPDGMSDADISKAILANFQEQRKPTQPVASMSAQPNTVSNWLQNVEGDLRQGGGETLPGRILQMLGAPGLERGIPESVANTAGGPLVGPVTTAQGVNAMRTDPWQGLMRTLEGIGQTTFPAQLSFAPKAAATVPQVAKILYGTAKTAKAGKAIGEVEQAAKALTVDPNAAGEVALRIKELTDAGSRPPAVVSKFLARVTDPKKGPLTFKEARDFYSNASARLSMDEFLKLSPKIQSQLVQFSKALGADITRAADQIGQGNKLANAMRQYGRGMGRQDKIDNVLSWLYKKGLPGAGLTALGGAGFKSGIDLYDILKR